jgi:hypothetical protein
LFFVAICKRYHSVAGFRRAQNRTTTLFLTTKNSALLKNYELYIF